MQTTDVDSADSALRPMVDVDDERRLLRLSLEANGIDQQHTRAQLMSSSRGRVDEELDASDSLDRCIDELAAVVDEDGPIEL